MLIAGFGQCELILLREFGVWQPHTAGHLCRYGKLLGSVRVFLSWVAIFVIIGGLYSPPVSARSCLLASFSRIFLRDMFEWTPLSLGLFVSISVAILEASFSSTVRGTSLTTVERSQSDYLSFSDFFASFTCCM